MQSVEGQAQLSGQLYGQGQQLLHALIKGLTGTSGLQRIHKTASILCHLMECMMTGENVTKSFCTASRTSAARAQLPINPDQTPCEVSESVDLLNIAFYLLLLF